MVIVLSVILLLINRTPLAESLEAPRLSMQVPKTRCRNPIPEACNLDP